MAEQPFAWWCAGRTLLRSFSGGYEGARVSGLGKRRELISRDNRACLPRIIVLAGYSLDGLAMPMKGRANVHFIGAIDRCAINKSVPINSADHSFGTVKHREQDA